MSPGCFRAVLTLAFYIVPMVPSNVAGVVVEERAEVDLWPRTLMFLSLLRCPFLKILVFRCVDLGHEAALHAELELPRKSPRETSRLRSAAGPQPRHPTKAVGDVVVVDRVVEEATRALVEESLHPVHRQ